MATTFKTLSSNDVTTTRTLLHEAIPITGTIVSGTYGDFPNEENIKNYTHKYFQSVYDYPYLSSSANHIFDISFGYGRDSVLSNSAGDGGATTAQGKKHNMYNHMAQVLVGHNTDGAIKQFQIPGADYVMDTVIFLSFSRLLVKDEIKKQSFSLLFATGSDYEHDFELVRKYSDDWQDAFYTDSPAGEYGILSASAHRGGTGTDETSDVGTQLWSNGGLIYYQAGIAVLTASQHFLQHMTGTILSTELDDGATFWALATGSEIPVIADGIRNRIENISFNNTTELNSTIHFCRANHNDFNYSSNPTYLNNSKIRVKDSSIDQSVTYITTVGLYSADNELLAVAKLSEPLKKTPDNELTIRVRLDY